MNDDAIKKLQDLLNNQKKPERFKIRDLDVETVTKMLYLCYQKEVGNRRIAFNGDKDTKDKIEKTAKWITGDYKVGLMVYGSVGNGKTTLLRSINLMLKSMYSPDRGWDEKLSIEYVTAIEIFNITKSDDQYRYKRIKDCDVLFIDDLGVEPITAKVWGNEISPITDIIYHRYDEQLCTIITSNLSDEALKERYGLRMADRMAEMFDSINSSGVSYRQ